MDLMLISSFSEKDVIRLCKLDLESQRSSLEWRRIIEDKEGNFRTWIPFAFWFCLGSAATILDQIHVYFGIMDHSNNIIDDVFPIWFSPSYGIGGILFYAVHLFFFPRIKREGIAGGKPIDPLHFIFQIAMGIFCYLVTGLLCGRGFENTAWPFLVGLSLLSFCQSNTRVSERPTLDFCLICASIGVGFEWFMGSQPFGFKHGLCPSISCLGTSVSLSWLPFLYMTAACFVHKIVVG